MVTFFVFRYKDQCVIWVALTVASVLYMSYIASPANFGRLVDPAHHVFRMTVDQDFDF